MELQTGGHHEPGIPNTGGQTTPGCTFNILKKYIIYVKDFIRSFVFFSFLISFIFSIQLLSLLRTIPGFVDVKILRFRLELTTILFTKVFYKFRCINLSALCKILIIITDGAA